MFKELDSLELARLLVEKNKEYIKALKTKEPYPVLAQYLLELKSIKEEMLKRKDANFKF